MPNFDALAEHLNSLHERKVPGCSVTVYQDGKKYSDIRQDMLMKNVRGTFRQIHPFSFFRVQNP